MAKVKNALECVNGANGQHDDSAAYSSNPIIIPRMQLAVLEVGIKGKSPLLVHAWDPKAKEMMLAKQKKTAQVAKAAKDPEADFHSSRYISLDGWDGVPASGFKAALVGAVRAVEGITLVMAKRLFFVLADGYTKDGQPLVKIEGEPQMHEAMVRVGMGTADIRFRAIYPEWSATLRIEFNRNLISQDQIVHLLEIAGHSEGICEWRPSAPKSNTGEFGRWSIVRE